MDAWSRFRRNRLALLGLLLVAVLTLSAALAPWLAPYDPGRQSLIEKRARPGAKYILGADEFGRDILSRVIYGSRVALLVGVLSATIAVAGGLVLGMIAGFSGGWLDSLMMRGIERRQPRRQGRAERQHDDQRQAEQRQAIATKTRPCGHETSPGGPRAGRADRRRDPRAG